MKQLPVFNSLGKRVKNLIEVFAVAQQKRSDQPFSASVEAFLSDEL